MKRRDFNRMALGIGLSPMLSDRRARRPGGCCRRGERGRPGEAAGGRREKWTVKPKAGGLWSQNAVPMRAVRGGRARPQQCAMAGAGFTAARARGRARQKAWRAVGGRIGNTVAIRGRRSSNGGRRDASCAR